MGNWFSSKKTEAPPNYPIQNNNSSSIKYALQSNNRELWLRDGSNWDVRTPQLPVRNISSTPSNVRNSSHPEDSNIWEIRRKAFDLNQQLYTRNLNPRYHDEINIQNFIIPDTPTPLHKITENWEMLESLFRANYVADENIRKIESIYSLTMLNLFEFLEMKRFFFDTNKRFFKVQKIVKVNNPYLKLQYDLKKLEYKKKGKIYKEHTVFHGTKMINIDSICKNNFDWRLTGTSRGHKFGQGVSFSPIAYYSTHYGDTGYDKVMIVAKVLIGKQCHGTRRMTIPPVDFDTSSNANEHVYVKYEDNTFYPAYLIYYGGIDTQSNGNANNEDSDDESDEDYDENEDYNYDEDNSYEGYNEYDYYA